MELIPNCSEYVARIELTVEEVAEMTEILKQMTTASKKDCNIELSWDYFDDYLKCKPGSIVFMGSQEEDAINKALWKIKK